jgi:hypothetical protein
LGFFYNNYLKLILSIVILSRFLRTVKDAPPPEQARKNRRLFFGRINSCGGAMTHYILIFLEHTLPVLVIAGLAAHFLWRRLSSKKQ